MGRSHIVPTPSEASIVPRWNSRIPPVCFSSEMAVHCTGNTQRDNASPALLAMRKSTLHHSSAEKSDLCAIKKVAAFAFEAVNDSMVRRCSNERRAYKGRGSFGGWNRGVFRLQKLGRSNDKDNRYCFADAVLLTLRLDVPPRRRGRLPAPCRNDPGCSDRFRERRLLRPDLTGAKSPTRAHTHTRLKRKETP